MSDPTEYVQPIMLLVDKSDPAAHLDAVRAVALASVRSYARDLAYGDALPIWDSWLSGPFAKSVRRADPKTFQKVLDQLDPNDYMQVDVGMAKAVAFRPVRASEMPKQLSRLQVSGTELPDDPAIHADVAVTVTLDEGLGMTTGKAAAQAAHALFLWYLNQEDKAVAVDCNIQPLPTPEFNALLTLSGSQAVIQDAGRTEIEPGSVTAFTVDAELARVHAAAKRAAWSLGLDGRHVTDEVAARLGRRAKTTDDLNLSSQ